MNTNCLSVDSICLPGITATLHSVFKSSEFTPPIGGKNTLHKFANARPSPLVFTVANHVIYFDMPLF